MKNDTETPERFVGDGTEFSLDLEEAALEEERFEKLKEQVLETQSK